MSESVAGPSVAARTPVTAADADRSTRILAVDALRGFALLGILVVHMVEQYLASPPPSSVKDFGVFSLADRIAQNLDGIFFIGKFFPMFALLFGVSTVIQAERAAARGEPYTGRFLWRLMLLLGIGLAHHALYRGDILSIYALLGLPLVFFLRAPDRLLIGLALLLAIGLPRALILAVGAVAGTPPSLMPPAGPELDAYYAALQAGDLRDIAYRNLTEGFRSKMGFQLGLFGRGYQTVALFLLGLWLARHRWHETLELRRLQLRRALWWSLGLAASALVFTVGAGFLLGPPASPDALTRVQAFVFLTGYDLFNLGIAGLFAIGFLLLFLRPRVRRWLRHLAPVGQTALTVYVSQTVIGTWLLYGHGLGLLGRIGAATAFVLALALFVAQMAIARLWLQHFRYGPLEWAWRSSTQLQIAPLRAEPRRAIAA